MAYIILPGVGMRKLSNQSISNSVDRLKLIGVFVLLMAALLMTGVLPAYAATTRLCGSTGNPRDIACGGSLMGGVGACGAGQYCCNEDHSITCGDTAWATSCVKQRDICQMPTVGQCSAWDTSCASDCSDGQYCCQHGKGSPVALRI
jgi:hypothetical protein